MASTHPSYAPLPATRSGGGPVLLIPAKLARHWRGHPDDYERACEPRDAVATDHGGLGWVEVEGGAALVLDGELETVWLPTSTGGIVARGDDINGKDVAAIVALLDQVDDWTPYVRNLKLDGPVWLYDSAYPGARKLENIEADDGAIAGKTRKGEYHVEYASVGHNDFVRLRKVSTAKRPPKTKLRLPEAELPPPRARTWKLGEPVYYDQVPAEENLLGVIAHGVRVGERILGIAGEVTEQRVVQCIEPDGSRRDLCKPAHFHGPSVQPGRSAFLVASHDGRLHEGTLDGEGLATVFEGKGPFWSVCAMGADHALLDISTELVLLQRPAGSAFGTAFAVKQHIPGYDFPTLRRLADPRFVYVDTSDNAALFALKDGRLHIVEGFPDTSKRGLRITRGRAFLYQAKNYDRWELHDWDAAYDEL